MGGRSGQSGIGMKRGINRALLWIKSEWRFV
jgi:hypothetical protein